jgi:hypothetical protein
MSSKLSISWPARIGADDEAVGADPRFQGAVSIVTDTLPIRLPSA